MEGGYDHYIVVTLLQDELLFQGSDGTAGHGGSCTIRGASIRRSWKYNLT